jgi:hypothetical protein
MLSIKIPVFYMTQKLTHSNHKICCKKQTQFSYCCNLILFYCGTVEHSISTAVLSTLNFEDNSWFKFHDMSQNWKSVIPSSFLLACSLSHASLFLQIFHTPPNLTQYHILCACSWSKEHTNNIRHNKDNSKYARQLVTQNLNTKNLKIIWAFSILHLKEETWKPGTNITCINLIWYHTHKWPVL